jgi:hypothetical protein
MSRKFQTPETQLINRRRSAYMERDFIFGTWTTGLQETSWRQKKWRRLLREFRAQNGLYRHAWKDGPHGQNMKLI